MPSQTLTPGTRLGPYEVIAPLGAGGMGEVYRARDTNLQRDAALKVLPEGLAGDAERLARFAREAQTLAAVNHPNIASVYGIEESGGVRALVMELVEGEDLSTILARGPMPTEDAVPIARQIAEALEAAHEQGIVHRDLKPANIKVRPDGTVKVLDFGLAKALDQSPGLKTQDPRPGGNLPTVTSPAMTERGVILGTAAYMSPEQAKGRPVDKRADIWSFGVVVHEMLTGVRLFEGESVTETLAAVLTQAPDFTALGDAPPAVTALLRRCLERDPKKRLRDIGEARLILTDPRTLEPAPLAPAPVAADGSAHGRPSARGSLLRAAAFIALGFAAGFAAAGFVNRSTGTQPVGSTLSISPITSSGNVISATISPDGRYMAYVESDQGRQSLWLRQMAGGQTLRLTPEDTVAFWSHTFTPDGNQVVYGLKSRTDRRGALYSISTLGGTPRRLIAEIDSPPTYSPDGRRMAFLRAQHPTTEQSSLVVSGSDGSDPEVLASVTLPDYIAGIFYGAPAWSPDGQTIVTALGHRRGAGTDATTSLVKVDVATGTVATLADPGWVVAAQAGWLPDGKSLLVIAQSHDQGATQVWSVSYPEGEARRVTTSLNDHRIISLTRDGRMLVTVAGVISSSVFTVPLTGIGRPHRVSRSMMDGLGGVAFTADGQLVYASRTGGRLLGLSATASMGGSSSLSMTSADGSSRGVLAAGSEGESLLFPTVADDGTVYHVAVVRSAVEIHAVALDGSNRRVLTRDGRIDSISASNDGQALVYSSLVAGTPQVFVLRPDGGAPRQLSTRPSFSPAVDPDGKRVAFYYVDPANGIRLGVMSVDGGPLLADLPIEPPAADSRLVLRDEGVYMNTVTGDRANVWLQPLDGKPAQRITSFDDELLFDFAISRDGSSLAVVRGPRLRDAQLITGFDGAPAGGATAPPPQ
jgi:serine/threonine protein kinase